MPVVRVGEPRTCTRGDRERDVERHALAERAGAREHVEDVLAVDELHRVEERVADLTEVEDLRDVRVLELRREARFVEEHRDPARIVIALGPDALEDHVALEACETIRAREEDFGHASLRQTSEQLVLGGRIPAQDLSSGHERRIPTISGCFKLLVDSGSLFVISAP